MGSGIQNQVLWRVKKENNIFSMTICTTVLAKWHVHTVARETLHHTKVERVLVKDSQYLNSGLPQVCDSRFYST